MNEDQLHPDIPLATLQLADTTVAGLRALADWIEEHPEQAARIMPGGLDPITLIVPSEEYEDNSRRIERLQAVAESAEKQVGARWDYRQEHTDARGTWYDVAFSKTVSVRMQVLAQPGPVQDNRFEAYARVLRAGGSPQEASAASEAVHAQFLEAVARW